MGNHIFTKEPGKTIVTATLNTMRIITAALLGPGIYERPISAYLCREEVLATREVSARSGLYSGERTF